MKKTKFAYNGRKLLPALAAAFFFFVTFASLSVASNHLVPTLDHGFQCKRIVKALENGHYVKRSIDDAMSSKILDQYLKRLDPRKQLFTLQDIEKFESFRYSFDDDLRRGRLDKAYRIFNVYFERAKTRNEYIQTRIAEWETYFDFYQDDSIIINYDLREWQKDLQALNLLWDKELKSHIISLLLDENKPESVTDTLEKIYTSRKSRLLQTESDDIFQIFMNIVTAGFDPHTQYLPPRLSEDFDIHMSKSLEGIGAVLQNEYEYTKVIRLIPKGPADKSAQLMPGDKIIGVGQGETGEIIDTIGQRIDHVVKLIRGPKNTYVRLKIIPAKKNRSAKTIQIKRDRVKLEEQSAKKSLISIKQGDRTFRIGVIELPDFYIDFNGSRSGNKDYKSASKDVARLINELQKEKIEGLIVDLRDNGGGSLTEAKDLVGLFLTAGPVVQIKHQRGVYSLNDENPAVAYRGPLIVMINRMSASASEIFAGAIKDYHRGIIVGSRTFGKGTVQDMVSLGEGKLKITRAKFYRVSGESTQHLGVLPDIAYPALYDVDDTGESSLDGALPWDTTRKSVYHPYPELTQIISSLDHNYKTRAQNDPGIAYLENRIEMASSFDDQTSQSLNLDVRRQKKESLEKKELELENQFRAASGQELLKNLEEIDTKRSDVKEIMMKQTQFIMADFITMSEQKGFSW